MYQFYKYQAIGNDYLVVDPRYWPDNTITQLSPAVIQALCDRHYGLGADGILFGPINYADAPDIVGVRIYNPDGSEAEKSGNGLRIFAKHVVDHGYVDPPNFLLATKSGCVSVSIHDALVSDIAIDMGVPRFDGDLALDNLNNTVGHRVSMGNPHCVVITESLAKAAVCRLGPIIETHHLLPNRTNVQFAKIINRHNIQVEIWERGAGYTLASGSSSCAVAAVALNHGWATSPVTISMPGGELVITQTDRGSLVMRGSVNYVAHGFINSLLITRCAHS